MQKKIPRVRQNSLGLIVFALLVFSSVTAFAAIIEKIVAVVNSAVVLQSELDERLQPILPQLQAIPDAATRNQRLEELRQQIINVLIDEELIKQEAQKLKITVSDQDLELAIRDVMRKNNLTQEGLEAALKQEGKTLYSYKETMLRPQMLRLRVLNVQVRSRLNVSDEEMKSYYQKNLRVLGVETKVRVKQIFIEVADNATPAKRTERKKFTKDLMTKLKAGMEFSELAKNFSQDTNTRDQGGDMGYIGRGTLPAGIEETVFSMKVGETRGPMVTENGFYIIQVVDRREASAKSFDEVKEDLREQIYMQKMEKATNAWLAEIRKKSYIDIKR